MSSPGHPAPSAALPSPQPSTGQLLRAILAALMLALALLFGAVLPAEYGIDPTGFGAKLGLTRLGAAVTEEASAAPSPAAVAGGPLSNGDAVLRSDQLSLTLAPGQGAEIKARMSRGEHLVFSWTAAGGQVEFDMHGEPLGGGDDFTSFRTGDNSDGASGAFTAPFDGTHGWYWHNGGERPVTLRLTTSGFYPGLYMP